MIGRITVKHQVFESRWFVWLESAAKTCWRFATVVTEAILIHRFSFTEKVVRCLKLRIEIIGARFRLVELSAGSDFDRALWLESQREVELKNTTLAFLGLVFQKFFVQLIRIEVSVLVDCSSPIESGQRVLTSEGVVKAILLRRIINFPRILSRAFSRDSHRVMPWSFEFFPAQDILAENHRRQISFNVLIDQSTFLFLWDLHGRSSIFVHIANMWSISRLLPIMTRFGGLPLDVTHVCLGLLILRFTLLREDVILLLFFFIDFKHLIYHIHDVLFIWLNFFI